MPTRNKLPTHHSYASVLLVLIMTLPALACGLISTPTPPPALETHALAPNFRLSTPFGDKVELNQLQGKIVIITFWVSWCEECIQDLNILQAIYEKNRDRDLVVLGINPEDSARKMIEFTKTYGLTFPLLLDPNHEIADRYHLAFYPTTFLISANGNLESFHTGPLQIQQLETQLAGMFSNPRMTSFILRDAFDVPASSLPAATETPLPPPPTAVITHLEGCVTAVGLKARSAPTIDAAVLTWLNNGECFRFDGRNQEGTWLRLDAEWTKNRQRLWVSAAYIDLQGDPLTLPLVPSSP